MVLCSILFTNEIGDVELDKVTEVIDKLRLMGYSVNQDEIIIAIGLRVNNDTLFVTHITDLEILLSEYDIISTIVNNMNSLIVKHYSNGGPRYDQSI